MAKAPKPVIGWREWVALPSLGIGAIKAKADTGARTSALHAFDVRIVRRGGQRFVKFKVHPLQRSVTRTVATEAPLVETRSIRSSSGHVSQRPVVLTTLSLGGQSFEIELTLVNRDAMGFRMLLGRAALRGHFAVDPGRSYLTGRRKPPRAG